MSLDHYGVLAGTLTGHERDTPDDQGRWYHVHLHLDAPLGSYRCAVDVDAASSSSRRRRGWRTCSRAVRGRPGRTSTLGMHNIHQNQGDPLASQWADENGIWQDGAVMVERPDGALDAFISKFSSQASQTDADGHPP